MNLADYAAKKRQAIFESLLGGQPPPEGEFDEPLFREGKDKGKPQMGATRFEPNALIFEFIYPVPDTAPILLSVRLEAPERIVFMPVPSWVVESVWQGDVSGSPRFESEAQELLEEFRALLNEGPNEALFAERMPIGRH